MIEDLFDYEIDNDVVSDLLWKVLGCTNEKLGQSETCSISSCTSSSTEFKNEFLSREEMEI